MVADITILNTDEEFEPDYLYGYLLLESNGLQGVGIKVSGNLSVLLPLVFASIQGYVPMAGFTRDPEMIYFICTRPDGRQSVFSPYIENLPTTCFDQIVVSNHTDFLLGVVSGDLKGMIDLREFSRNFNYDTLYFEKEHAVSLETMAFIDQNIVQISNVHGRFALFNRQLQQLTDFSFDFPVAIDRFGNFRVSPIANAVPLKQHHYTASEFFQKFGV